MEEQFNRRHGEVKLKYVRGQPGLVKDYLNGKEVCIKRRLIRRSGKDTNDMDIDYLVWV